jgi:hypothetical protein
VYWELLLITSISAACGPGRFPLMLQCSQFVPQEQQASKPCSIPKMCQRVEEANRALSSVLEGENEENLEPSASLSAFKPYQEVHYPMGRIRMVKLSDPQDLKLELSVLPGDKPHTARDNF